MKLDFIEIAGFRGFRDKLRIELPAGFVVVTGRNGVGKSTILDAVDFALTGTINKYSVTAAKGGGLDQHIWWVGPGTAKAHYVAIGFKDINGDSFILKRSRDDGLDVADREILTRICQSGSAPPLSIEKLMETTLIRDERIAALSLDLPQNARFAAVRDAIGAIAGTDYSERTASILNAARSVVKEEQDRSDEIKAELSRVLTALTEARSEAERSSDISEATRTIEAFAPNLPSNPNERAQVIRSLIADRKTALRALNDACSVAATLETDIEYFASEKFAVERKKAEEVANELRGKGTAADEKYRETLRLENDQRDLDRFMARLATLIENGHAIGLQDDHCPLCNAFRTNEEFENAINATRTRLSDGGKKLALLRQVAVEAQEQLARTREDLRIAEARLADLDSKHSEFLAQLARIRDLYAQYQFDVLAEDVTAAHQKLNKAQNELIKLERAAFILEGSIAVERVTSLETRVANLREQQDGAVVRVVDAEKVVDATRQIDQLVKSVANEILTEQFDTVMPLLKELYRRLRPHVDWVEIESDFGGRVRGSLNFFVGNGHNPQFLFSSGQRRAAGLAFLLAIHLSRPWCRWNSLLLDDPVQHIDDYRALNLVEVLAAIRRSGRQIIVAIEDPLLADLLCRRLRSTPNETGRRYDLRVSSEGTGEIESTQDIRQMPREILQLSAAS